MAIELEPPVSKSSTGSRNFYLPPTDSEHKFHKTGIENWLPIGFNLEIIIIIITTVGERLKVLYSHPKSLRITLETYHKPKTAQVLSNPTPSLKSSTNPQ